jgi:SAM-dependent methyltransferase
MGTERPAPRDVEAQVAGTGGGEVQDRIRRWWDEDAATYDDTPSHAATDPVEAAAWRAALLRFLPPPPARVLDVGAGTGSMTMLAAGLGYRMTALDLSEEMLGRARHKADELGLDVDFHVGPGSDPPHGPFDAVMERHVLWTTMDPVGALQAWRGVTAPGGRLVLFEGIWRPADAVSRARHSVAGGFRRLRGEAHDHHAEYDAEMLAGLPLAGQTSARPLVVAVEEAGWRNVRIERIRDVEWIRQSAGGVPGRIAGVTPQFAVVADAPR